MQIYDIVANKWITSTFLTIKKKFHFKRKQENASFHHECELKGYFFIEYSQDKK